MTKKYPSHIEAEKSVISSVMWEPKLLGHFLDKLNIDDFFIDKHVYIYQSLKSLSNKNVKEIINLDPVTIYSELEKTYIDSKKTKTASSVVNIEYLQEIYNEITSTSYFDTYVELLKDVSLKRKLIKTAEEIIEEGTTKEDISSNEYLDFAEKRLLELSSGKSRGEFSKINDIVKEIYSKSEKIINSNHALEGLSTGYTRLDKALNGLGSGHLIILASRPGMGKTAFALNLALNVAATELNKKPTIAFFSLEMSNEELVKRMISMLGGIENHKLRGAYLNADDWTSFREVRDSRIQGINILFDESNSSTIEDIRAKSRQLKLNGSLDMVVIDYLGLINGSRETKGQNRQVEVSHISRSLKSMAKELKIPILAVAQLNRKVDDTDDKEPKLTDLRDSGSIEQDADVVLFLNRQDYYNKTKDDVSGTEGKPSVTQLILAKNRHGGAGFFIEYQFYKQYSQFIEMEARIKAPENKTN
ncbi:MAG: replicative DNA helicase [Acholeplasmatales bacterium]|jgi:replicative DNA helicase|nr:replicative DNA helicase [Acholeplasmatales bacterium]